MGIVRMAQKCQLWTTLLAFLGLFSFHFWAILTIPIIFLFSFILINGGNEKVRMEEKSKEK